MKIVLIGLPLFSKGLQRDINSFDSKCQSVSLDTYYNWKDKLRALFLIPFCDVVYSINGTLDNSRTIDWALFWNKKVMMLWVGTDVLNAAKSDAPNQKYLSKCYHYCEADWIKSELLAIGIKAKTLFYINFTEETSSTFPISDGLSVLSYISKGREEFYGWNYLVQLAKELPDVKFRIVGTDGKGLEVPQNVVCLGWLPSLENEFDRAHVTIRWLEHDGLSRFVHESLLREKYVLYTFPVQNCFHVRKLEDGLIALNGLKQQLVQGELLPNSKGREYVLNKLSRELVLSKLISEMRNLIST